MPGEEYPVVLPRTSEGLYLLQRLRDEAHRFAITFHRQRRSKAMTTSQLDGIPGLGEKRRKALLKRVRVGQAHPGRLGRRARRRPRDRACAGGRRCGRVGLDRRRACRRSTSPPVRWSTTKGQTVPIERAVADDEPGGGGLPPVPRSTDFVIVTGMSGAGRSTAANVIEDRGWYVVDNLPPQLLSPMADLAGEVRDNGRQRPAHRRRRRRAGARVPLRAAGRRWRRCATPAGTRT